MDVNMCTLTVTTLFFLMFNFMIDVSTSSNIFHEQTNIMFTSGEGDSEYFGYSTVLSEDGLLVGAPKAVTTQAINKKALKLRTGTVYLCPLTNLEDRRIICRRFDSQKVRKWYMRDKLNKDIWFGASVATLTNHRLLVAAPRQGTTTKRMSETGSLQGSCYFLSSRRSSLWNPLGEPSKIEYQTFKLDGKRPSFGQKNVILYNYNFGEAGFSLAVTKMNTILLGAPGLMQFTGGMISYLFNPNDTLTKFHQYPIANTYYTMDLEADDYFGYSVESGIFEKNGSVLYIGGAPRADLGRGKVLIIEPPVSEVDPLAIKFRLLGPQVGSYFGSSLCCTDINNDGLDDLLVGAPTFVKHDGALPYDQGAVFIYMAKESDSGFVLEESGYVSGSGANGARFGTTIAGLGDINGDDFKDVAVGAPWENDGVGAVYIYLGGSKGLKNQNVQRIQPVEGQGFGWSIAKGLDVDNNKCNDLAIGAYSSGSSYLYRCIPTIPVRATIRVTNHISLPRNTTTFTSMFCVSAPRVKLWPNAKLNLTGRIEVDPTGDRAALIGDNEYNVIIAPANEQCHEKTISVNLTADLIKPIVLKFELEAHELMTENSTSFLSEATRVSEDSTMKVSKSIQVLVDCGDDLVCMPWLNVDFDALDNPYIPGTNNRLGVILTIANEGEPAYGVKVNINMPSQPKRIPSECYVKDLIMTCDLPQPFLRNDEITWEVEMEYELNTTEQMDLPVTATFENIFLTNNITEEYEHNVQIEIRPEANFSVIGQSMQNTSIIVFRDNLNAGANISFKHFYTISNAGPSDWYALVVKILIPYKAYLTDEIEGCEPEDSVIYVCLWNLPANTSRAVTLPLQIDLSSERDFFETSKNYSAMSIVLIATNQSNIDPFRMSYRVYTTLLIEQASIPLWYIIVPCIFLGLLLLSLITWILYKRNFFSRKTYDQLKQEKKQQEQESPQWDDSQTSPSDAEDDKIEISHDIDIAAFEMSI